MRVLSERPRESREFVLSNHLDDGYTWGFVVYRTVYTKESDENWHKILEKLNAFLRYEVEWELRNQEPYEELFEELFSPEPNRVICESFKNVVLDDKLKYDGADFEFIRQNLDNFFENRESLSTWRTTEKACVVIDEEVFNVMLSAPDPSEDIILTSRIQGPAYYVKLVDGIYDPDHLDDPQYPGWLKASMGKLWSIFGKLEYSMLETRCERAADGTYFFIC